MLQAEDLQHRLDFLVSDVPWLEDPALLLVGNPLDSRAGITPEHQALEDIIPVLLGILCPTGGEVLHLGACRILCQNLELPRLTSIQAAVNYPPDHAGAGHVSGVLEYHHLEDNAHLSVPVVMLDSCEFRGQRVHEAQHDSPDWRIVAPRRHDRSCPPSLLSFVVVCKPPTEV